jgi:F0F1-type ATP synthase membrane subunit a
MFLELLIAFLQAYVFTILVTLYINDVLNMHE